MPSAVQICSNALLMLGAGPINSFTEADTTGSGLDRARLASNLYPSVQAAVLRSHPWNCATSRVILSPLSIVPAYGYSFQYQLPTNWLRTLAVGQYETDRLSYRTEGQSILFNDNPLYLTYLFLNLVETTYDAALIYALELKMASVMAYGLTKSTSLKTQMENEFQLALKSARTSDGQDDPHETLGDFPMLQSRFTHSGFSIKGVDF